MWVLRNLLISAYENQDALSLRVRSRAPALDATVAMDLKTAQTANQSVSGGIGERGSRLRRSAEKIGTIFVALTRCGAMNFNPVGTELMAALRHQLLPAEERASELRNRLNVLIKLCPVKTKAVCAPTHKRLSRTTEGSSSRVRAVQLNLNRILTRDAPAATFRRRTERWLFHAV